MSIFVDWLMTWVWTSFMVADVYLQLRKGEIAGGYVVVSWSQLLLYWWWQLSGDCSIFLLHHYQVIHEYLLK